MSKALEREFEKLVAKHKAEIDAKVDEAEAALAEAVKLSNAYGIPFNPGISFLSQTYTPQSYMDKFKDGLDKDLVWNLTNSYPGGEWGYAGWEHSAVC